MLLYRPSVVTTFKEVSGYIQVLVIGPGQSICQNSCLAIINFRRCQWADRVGSEAVWLKKSAELIVFLLCDGIELVVVTARAAKSESKESFARTLNGLKQPCVTIKLVLVTTEKTCGS